MTEGHKGRYFWEWGKAREWYLSRGWTAKDADAKRHALHVKALGRAKSSKDFTNPDLDKVIAAFRAVHDGGNLDAQLDQIDQPDQRREALERRLLAAGATFISGDNPKQREWRTISYARGIWEKLGFGAIGVPWQWPMRDVKQLGQVMGVIERRAQQVLRKQQAEEERLAAVPADAADEEISG